MLFNSVLKSLEKDGIDWSSSRYKISVITFFLSKIFFIVFNEWEILKISSNLSFNISISELSNIWSVRIASFKWFNSMSIWL